MTPKNINSLSQEGIDGQLTNVTKAISGNGIVSYQDAFSQLFKTLGEAFVKVSSDLKKSIETLKDLDAEREKITQQFDKNSITGTEYGKSLASLATREVKLKMKASSQEGSMNDLLTQDGQASGIEKAKTIQLEKEYTNRRQAFINYTKEMFALQSAFEDDIKELDKNKEVSIGTSDEKRYEDARISRSNSHQASLLKMQYENQEFAGILEKDLTKLSNKAQKDALKESQRAVKQLRKFIKDNRKNLNSDSPEINDELESFEKKADGIQENIDKVKEKNKSKISPEADLRAISDAFKTCADSVRHFNEPLADSFEIVSGIANGAADVVKGISTMSTNPIQGVASVAKGVMGLVGTFAKRNAENKAAKKQYELQQAQEYINGLEYNKILRERLRLEKQIGQTTVDYAQKKSEELNKQQRDINKEYQTVFWKLQKEKYVEEEKFIHKTWFRKARTEKTWGSLLGMDYDTMEKLYTTGKFEGETKILFERLKVLKEEGENIDKMLKEFEQEMKQAWTGTTSNAVADSIVEGFMNGKRAAEDFTESFEDMMRKAMMQAIKMKHMEGPLNEWYEKFAEASEEGLTKENIDNLRKDYQIIIDTVAEQAEIMEKATNISFVKNPSENQTEAQKGIAAMTQDTASELNGRFYTLQWITSTINDNVSSIQHELIDASHKWLEIAENTRYCRKLEGMETDMRSMKNDINSIALKGIRLLR